MRLYVLATLGIVLFSCTSESSKSNAPQQNLLAVMPGTWESVSINVRVNSANNQPDSSYVFDVPEKDWRRILGVQPIKTYYEPGAGSTYYSEYIDLDGKITQVTRGKWFVQGDSLLLVTPEASYQYEVLIEGGKGTFHSFIDWDGDGEEDDEYTGVQRKISKYVK